MNKGCHGVVSYDSEGYIRKTNNVKGYSKLWSLMKNRLFTVEKDCKISVYNKSYQVEYDFYNDVEHARDEIGVKIPIIKCLEFDYWNCCYNIIMEDLSKHKSYHEGMNYDDCLYIIDKIAQFHLFFYNNYLLQNCWEYGGYWTDDKRNKSDFPIKLSLMKKNFNDNFNWLLDESRILDLCNNNRSGINNFLMKQNTIIHGDFKIGNIFNSGDNIYLIDFQWIGKGHCITDICYFIITSLYYKELNMFNCITLIKSYMKHYSNEINNTFIEDFIYCLLDLFQYFVCYKWYNITIDTLEYNKNNNIDGLHVRYFEQITSIINLLFEMCELL